MILVAKNRYDVFRQVLMIFIILISLFQLYSAIFLITREAVRYIVFAVFSASTFIIGMISIYSILSREKWGIYATSVFFMVTAAYFALSLVYMPYYLMPVTNILGIIFLLCLWLAVLVNKNKLQK
ncbi:MAG: hypothetical protein HZB66_01300 [Candidatus Aenigmarchaeota archaeon]|nr:hypothetical protein [Candidatus Aenigmarchaeota archaeon]